MERIKDYLLMEEEFIQNQERLKPQEERNAAERSKLDELRGSPLTVGSLEEMIDDNHAIISTTTGSEHYVNVLSFVDKDQLEPGGSILAHNKVCQPEPVEGLIKQTMSVVGILQDESDPLVNVMKVEKAPTETYGDIGGLDAQIQEIKVCSTWLYVILQETLELPLTHPELYEEMGIRPPKGPNISLILLTL